MRVEGDFRLFGYAVEVASESLHPPPAQQSRRLAANPILIPSGGWSRGDDIASATVGKKKSAQLLLPLTTVILRNAADLSISTIELVMTKIG